MKLDGSGFSDFLKAFNALPEEEKAEALKFADEATKGMFFIPNPGPQTDAYFCQADELFYGGAGGGGKSALLCGLAANDEHHDVQLFRRESTQLRGLVKELQTFFGTTDGFNSQTNVWRRPANKVIELAGIKDEKDKFAWQGRAADLKGFDEITHFSKSQYKFIIGWNRTTRPGQRCRVVATGNPPMDENGLWVIEHWAPWLDETYPDPAMPGELRWPARKSDADEDEDKEIFFRSAAEALEHLKTLRTAPRDLEGNILPPRSRTFIPAHLEDNPDLMRSGYAAVIEAMPKELREAMKGKFKQTFADDEFQVIPTAWVIEAQKRWTPHIPPDELMTAMGVDIAQGGADRTVIAPRYGDYFANLIVKPGSETPDGPTGAALIVLYQRDGATINIDLGGGWGGSAYDHLASNDLDLFAYVGANPSTGRTLDGKLRFKNVRAESWWRLREGLDPSSPNKIALPPDPELRRELTATKWKPVRVDGSLGIQLEDKADIKTRLNRSPDKGDAVVMAWFTGDNRKRRAQKMQRRYRNVDLPTEANLGGRQLHRHRTGARRGNAEVYSAASSSYRDEQG